MKRIALVVLLLGVVLSLTQCDLFQLTLEYTISGQSDNLIIRFNDPDTGEIVDATASSPWTSGEFILYSGDEPFLAYIGVTNSDTSGGAGVRIQILEDGNMVNEIVNLPTGNSDYCISIIE